MEGSVGPPLTIRSCESASGVRRMPTIATVRSQARKPRVQLAAFATRGSVPRVQAASTAK
ncbi:hypothetical protein SALBM135S_03674 [Streptomyces alboniger]